MNCGTSGRIEKAGRAGIGGIGGRNEKAGTGETSGTSGRIEKAGRAGIGGRNEKAGTGEKSGAGETSGVFFCFCGLSFVICNYFVSLSLEIYNSKIDNY